jgi:hypothetical protein
MHVRIGGVPRMKLSLRPALNLTPVGWGPGSCSTQRPLPCPWSTLWAMPSRRGRANLLVRQRANDCLVCPTSVAGGVWRPRQVQRRCAASLRRCSASALAATAPTKPPRDAAGLPWQPPGRRPSTPRLATPLSGCGFPSLTPAYSCMLALVAMVSREKYMYSRMNGLLRTVSSGTDRPACRNGIPLAAARPRCSGP